MFNAEEYLAYGVLALVSHKTNYFTNFHMDFVSELANQISLALRMRIQSNSLKLNVLTLSSVDSAKRELKYIEEAVFEITKGLEVDGILKRILEAILELSGARYGTVELVEPDTNNLSVKAYLGPSGSQYRERNILGMVRNC